MKKRGFGGGFGGGFGSEFGGGSGSGFGGGLYVGISIPWAIDFFLFLLLELRKWRIEYRFRASVVDDVSWTAWLRQGRGVGSGEDSVRFGGGGGCSRLAPLAMHLAFVSADV